MLPYVHLEWDEVTPGPGVTFVRYVIYRDGSRIGSVDSIASPTFDDYRYTPNQEHLYTVTWVGEAFNAEIESLPIGTYATLQTSACWVHRLNSPEIYAEMPLSAVTVQKVQVYARRRARGRRLPTTFFGEGLWREADISLAVRRHDADQEPWELLELLQDDQYGDAALLVLQTGVTTPGTMMVCAIEELQRSDRPGSYTVSARLVEQHYDEA